MLLEKTMEAELDHIAIQVKDVSKAVAWYLEKFKYEVNFQDDSWALLKFNNISLTLVLPKQHPQHFSIIKN
jgi:hypothetical protein